MDEIVYVIFDSIRIRHRDRDRYRNHDICLDGNRYRKNISNNVSAYK